MVVGILTAVACFSGGLAVVIALFHPTVATIATAALGVSSPVLLFSASTQRYLDQWEARRAGLRVVR